MLKKTTHIVIKKSWQGRRLYNQKSDEKNREKQML